MLSGDPDPLAAIVTTLRADGVFCRQVQVDYASHAPQIEPLRPDLLDALDGLRPRSGQVPIHSTVVDRVVDGAGFDAEYWADNLSRPVRFDAAVRAALADRRPAVFVEVSPHPILGFAIEDGIADASAQASLVVSLRRGEPEYATMLSGLAAVYAAGGRVAFDRVNAGGRFVDVPGYSWQHRRFWVDGGSVALPERRAVVEGVRPPLIDARHLAEAAATVPGCVHYLRTSVSMLLGLPDVDPTVPLPALGLDSVFAGRLAYRIRSELGLPVSVADLLGARSIEELADELSEVSTQPRSAAC